MSDASLTSQLPSDAELITSARTGDDRAFGELFKRHEVAAKAAARSLTRSRADIDDLVAEAFTRVLQALRAGRGPEVAFRPYLLTCVRNAFYDRARKDKRIEFTDEPEDTLNVSLLDSTASGEDRQLIVQAYASLPERWQLALWHTEVEGRSAAEVGTLLAIAPNAVAALTYRAREGLRQAYLQAHLQQQTPEACQACRPNLGAYVRDGLATRDRRKVDEHLGGCEACSTLLVELRETNTHLRAVLIPLLLGVSAAKYLGMLSGGKGLLGLIRRAEPRAQAAMGAATAAAVVAGAITVAALAGGGPPMASVATTTAPLIVPAAAEPPPPDATAGAPSEEPVVPVVVPPTDTPGTLAPETTPALVLPTAATSPVPPPTPQATSTIAAKPTTPTTRATTTTTTLATTVATTRPTSTTSPSTTGPSTTGPTTTSPSTTGPSTTGPTTTGPTTSTTAAPPLAPDLVVAAAPAGPFIAGQYGYAKVTVRNNPSVGGGAGAGVLARRLTEVGPAIDPILTLSVPDGVTVASTSAWSCESAPMAIVCHLPTLQPGDLTEAVIELRLPAVLPASVAMRTTVTTADGTTLPGGARSFTVAPGGTTGYARQMPGGVVVIGNTVMSCTDADLCAEAQAGTAPGTTNTRHSHFMDYVDVDADGATFASSTATLAIPPGATVAYALLGWTGDTAAGVGGHDAPDASARGSVVFGTPTGTARLAADRVRTPGATSTTYYATADVTDLVTGSGTYSIADVQAGTGRGTGAGGGRFGGWTLTVVYRDTAAPRAFLVVIDQYATLDGGPTNISVSLAGITPADGKRPVTLVWSAAEGDRGLASETATVNGQVLSDALNPGGDVFNSTTSTAPPLDPGYVNTLGIDADSFQLTLPASDTAVTLSLTSPRDFVRLGAIGLAIGL